MIWILLAALGVPLWLIVGALLGALYSRRRFEKSPGVFGCKLRLVSGSHPGVKAKWGRRPGHARWVHDVLLVQRGIALARTFPLAVCKADGPEAAPVDVGNGLEASPRCLSLLLDDGAQVQLAAAERDLAAMVGPFGSVSPAPSA